MTLEETLVCPHCDYSNFLAVDVPYTAWFPGGGASWQFSESCEMCEEIIEYSGRVESSIEHD